MKTQTKLIKKYAAAFAKLADKLSAKTVMVRVESVRNRYATSTRFAVYNDPDVSLSLDLEVKDFGDFQKFETKIGSLPTNEYPFESEFITKANEAIQTLLGENAPQLEVQP